MCEHAGQHIQYYIYIPGVVPDPVALLAVTDWPENVIIPIQGNR